MSVERVKPTRVAPQTRGGAIADRSASHSEQLQTPPQFRPFLRPPMAQLVILDDGAADGEVVRMRGPRLIIGRTHGDIVIPHDPLISAEHLEITRREESDGYRWYLKDLNSTNGTFVRMATVRIRHNYELILGSNRYRFCLPQPVSGDSSTDTPTHRGTKAWAAVSRDALAQSAAPALVQLDGDAEVARYSLANDQIIGSSQDGASLVIDDPYLSPTHARLVVRPERNWWIKDLNSTNGVWLRAEHSCCSQRCEFQLGEQRFELRVL